MAGKWEDTLELLRYVKDFDSFYSKGLLVLGQFAAEKRFVSLRLPVVSLTIGYLFLQAGLTYKVYRWAQKNISQFWGLAIAAATAFCGVELWFHVPVVQEYIRLEVSLAYKYQSAIYIAPSSSVPYNLSL